MQNTDIKSEILNLEKKYWTAMSEHDLETALGLTDFPCVVAGANGVLSVDKEQFSKMFNSNQESVRSFNFEEDKAEVRQVGPDTAVIAYKVHTTVLKDGKNQKVDAVDASTWIRRGDKWVCAMHTEAELPQMLC